MDITNFAAGFAHPFNGADHILAMGAIGLWSARAGGRALWVWPLTFVSTVLAGFVVAILGIQIPLVEPAIASSIVVLGLLVALAVQMPVWSGALIAGLFAFFHGHAHGTEAVTAGVDLIAFAGGFSLATAALHGVGLGAGFLISRSAGQRLLRTTGGLIAAGGLTLLTLS